MSENQEVSFRNISAEQAGQRIDNFLLGQLKGVPKSHIYKLIRRGEVRINKKRTKPTQKLVAGDVVRIPPVRITPSPATVVPNHIKQRIENAIVYEDADFLVINKPPGIAVHGGSGLSFGVIETVRDLLGDPKIELVHRLDKDTSGCLLLSKNRQSLLNAHKALREKLIRKCYLALLDGVWRGPKQKIVDKPLLKNVLTGGERYVEISSDGKAAKTMFQLEKNFADCCLVKAYPVTGRTHQIRVHAKSLGQPICGDRKYGTGKLLAEKFKPPRLFLHAHQLSFKLDGKPFFFTVSVDEAWCDFIHQLAVE